MQLAEWTGFLAAQLYNAGTAVVAHVPAWLPGVSMQRETVWLRRLVLLESIAPVLGSTAAMVRYFVRPNSSTQCLSLHMAWQLLAHLCNIMHTHSLDRESF